METFQIVVDTNILVAAFRSKRGAANLFIDRLRDSRWQVNVSTPLLLEYEEVLKRPEMSEFISPLEVDCFLDALCSISVCHDIFFLWRLLTRDPEDAFLFELAVRTKADFLVTYNPKDFINLTDFGVKSVTRKGFLQIVGDLR